MTTTSAAAAAFATPGRIDDRQRQRCSSEVREGLVALRPELYARAMRLSRSPAQADDIVQETMLRALRFELQYHAGTNLRAWVGQVLMSVFLTQCRRRKRETRALDHLLADPCAWTRQEPAPVMQSLSKVSTTALGALPKSYRKAIELVDLQGLSYRDAADRLAVPVGTIMSRLHRGRRLLALALGPVNGWATDGERAKPGVAHSQQLAA